MRRLYALCFVILLALLLTAPLSAQAGPAMAAGAELCVAYGAIIAIAVSILKRIPFRVGKWIGTHPKVCATFLSTLAALAPMLGKGGVNVAALAVCIGAYFAGAQGMYQGVLKPAGDALGLAAEPRW